MEKYAVMSDFHGCLTTFNMMLADALQRGIKKFIFLGDFVTDGYNSNAIIGRVNFLKEHGFEVHCIRGNREKYIANYHEMNDDFNKRKNRLALGYESLSADSLAFINSLKETEQLEIDGKKVLLIHGDNFDFSNGNDGVISRLNERYDYDVCFFGHTHQQLFYKNNKKIIINPGSISQPLDKPQLSYCIVSFNDVITSTYVNVDVDNSILEIILQEYMQTGFSSENPEWIEFIMSTVRDSIDYVAIFMRELMTFIKGRDVTVEEFNNLFTEKYKLFAEKYGLYQIPLIRKNTETK